MIGLPNYFSKSTLEITFINGISIPIIAVSESIIDDKNLCLSYKYVQSTKCKADKVKSQD